MSRGGIGCIGGKREDGVSPFRKTIVEEVDAEAAEASRNACGGDDYDDSD